MVEVLLVGCDERVGVAPVKSSLEQNVGVGAGSQVKGRALGEGGTLVADHLATLLQVVGGVASSVLSITLRNAAGQRARVGRVGACVMLHVAGAANGSADANKGIAVDAERAVSRGRDDRRWCAPQGPGELLHIATCCECQLVVCIDA